MNRILVGMAKPYQERRSLRRTAIDLPAALYYEGASIGCTVLNLSSTGAKIQIHGPLEKKGDKIVVDIEGFEDVAATIIWLSNGCLGVAFDHRSQEIAAYLEEE